MVHTVDITVGAATTAAALYATLTDGPSWPRWGVWDEFERVRPGGEAPDGIGSVRVLRVGRIRSKEEIVELVPNRRIGYRLVDGMPLRDYAASIELHQNDSGTTTIRWRSRFRPVIFGTGWLYRSQIERAIRRSLDGLISEVARSTG